jgi:hypothetical protein
MRWPAAAVVRKQPDGYIFTPTAAALLGFLVTMVIDRPVSEVLRLRGFVVGFALRIARFSSMFVALEAGG